MSVDDLIFLPLRLIQAWQRRRGEVFGRDIRSFSNNLTLIHNLAAARKIDEARGREGAPFRTRLRVLSIDDLLPANRTQATESNERMNVRYPPRISSDWPVRRSRFAVRASRQTPDKPIGQSVLRPRNEVGRRFRKPSHVEWPKKFVLYCRFVRILLLLSSIAARLVYTFSNSRT